MKKVMGLICLCIAATLMGLGTQTTVPNAHINSWKTDRNEGGMYEYVGGDAYNFIIEAGLRGGEIAGAQAAKAIYFVGAGILTGMGLIAMCDDGKRKTPSEGTTTFEQKQTDGE